MNTKICTCCQKSFAVSDQDQAFYKKIGISEPKKCPDCRSRQRMSFRNERTLYRRKCSLCGKNMITIYSENKVFPVYCQDCYWSDKWDGSAYSQELNFEEPFFEQFKKLMQRVPRLALVNKQSENSEYCNYSFGNKNCYLNFGSHYEEDCFYGHYSTKNKDCVDFVWLYESELCYESIFSKKCYRCVYLDHCENCLECYFSFDLKGCKNCLFSANLRHKEYYIFNKPHTKEEYFKKLEELDLKNKKSFQKALEIYIKEVRHKFPMKDNYQINCENCEGSTHENSKNLQYCFNCTKCEDCAYCFQMDETYSSMDTDFMGYDHSELCYGAIGCSGIYNCMSCDSCWHNNDLFYCQLSFNSKNCFGCISMNHKQYHILNKKYSKEEYGELMTQIIEHMKKNDEWGDFFPENLSPFEYFETVAQEHFPKMEGSKISMNEPAQNKNSDRKTTEKNNSGEITCTRCNKAFRTIPQELKFYQEMHLPIPEKCPLCRYLDRYQFRRPRQIIERQCAKCRTNIKTCFSKERPEIVYCEKCYREMIY